MSASASASASTDFGMASPEVPDDMSDVRVRFYGGINVGSYHSTVCSAGVGSTVIELEPNDLSSRSTPSTISFCDSLRLIGDVAQNTLINSPETCFPILPLLLLLETDPENYKGEDLYKRFSPYMPTALPFVGGEMEEQTDTSIVNVTFADQQYSLKPSQLIAFYLRRLAGFAAEGRRHKLSDPEDILEVASGRFCVAFPNALMANGDIVGKVISKTCRTGALKADSALYCGQMTAIVACWVVKHLVDIYTRLRTQLPEGTTTAPTLYVSFFNCGFSETSFAVLEARPLDAAAVLGTEPLSVHQFALEIKARNTLDIGVYDMLRSFALMLEKKAVEKDSTIGTPFTSAIESANQTKRQRRIWNRHLTTAQKVMRELGGLNTAFYSANLGNEDGNDVQFEVRREEFERCLATPILSTLREWLKTCVEQGNEVVANENGVYLGCEIVGGGSRIPVVVETLTQQLKSQSKLGNPTSVVADKTAQATSPSTAAPETATILRRTLDGTAAPAVGCTALAGGMIPRLEGVYKVPSSCETWASDEERRSYMTTEREMREIEEAEHKRLEAKNKLEAKIMELEGLIRDNVKGSQELRPAVEKASEWFYSVEDADQPKCSLEKFQEELGKLETEANTHCAAHYEQLAEAKAASDQKLEANAARVEAENAGKEKDDHDNRHLPNSQRLQLARKNKDEGNELLKGGTLAMAIQRYLKAIGHLGKMFDCSPAETEEKNALMLACHLNMAQTYLKEGSAATAQKAVQSCTSALEIDPENHKGLFRRGQAYERLKDMEAAKKDLAKVIASQSPPDPAVVKCIERVERAIKAENEKAKRMYGKMFG